MKNLTKGGYSVEKPHFQHYLYSKTSLNQKQLPGEKKPIIFLGQILDREKGSGYYGVLFSFCSLFSRLLKHDGLQLKQNRFNLIGLYSF